MASVQARREKVRDGGGILVEKDKVPKMATHFESLAGKAREDQVSDAGESESERKRREGKPEKRGKKAGGFVGAEVKDQVVVVTLEKVAGMTSSVAGYTGEKVVVVKDKVGGAGMNVVRYAGEKIAATTDVVVAAEEKAAEYAARKQAEAREARRTSNSHEIAEESEAAPEKLMGVEEEQGGSILEAIGETIVEIGETTKAFLLGLNPIQHKDEAEFRKEH